MEDEWVDNILKANSMHGGTFSSGVETRYVSPNVVWSVYLTECDTRANCAWACSCYGQRIHVGCVVCVCVRYAPNENVCGIYRFCIDCSQEVESVRVLSKAVAQRWKPESYWIETSSLPELQNVHDGYHVLFTEQQLELCKTRLVDIHKRFHYRYMDPISIRLGMPLADSAETNDLNIPPIMDDGHVLEMQEIAAWSMRVLQWMDTCYVQFSNSKGLPPLHQRYSRYMAEFNIFSVALALTR